MNIYHMMTFTLLLTTTSISQPQSEEKKGKFGWLEYSQPETLHKVEIMSKSSTLNCVSGFAGICGITLIYKGIDAAVIKDKDKKPMGVQLNAASVLYITTGALMTVAGYFGVKHSDQILDIIKS